MENKFKVTLGTAGGEKIFNQPTAEIVQAYQRWADNRRENSPIYDLKNFKGGEAAFVNFELLAWLHVSEIIQVK